MTRATPLFRVIFARIAPALHKKVRMRAVEEDRTINQVVERALEQYLRRAGK